MGEKACDYTVLKTLIDSNDRRYSEKFAAQEIALSKAETAYDKRFESVNEFRTQLKDQAGTFVTRTELDAKLTSVIETLNLAMRRLDAGDGQEKGFDRFGAWVLAAVAIGVSILALFTK